MLLVRNTGNVGWYIEVTPKISVCVNSEYWKAKRKQSVFDDILTRLI